MPISYARVVRVGSTWSAICCGITIMVYGSVWMYKIEGSRVCPNELTSSTCWTLFKWRWGFSVGKCLGKFANVSKSGVKCRLWMHCIHHSHFTAINKLSRGLVGYKVSILCALQTFAGCTRSYRRFLSTVNSDVVIYYIYFLICI